MDLKKKAIMETQFVWIFILVVGAVILIFFVGVSKSQRESSEVKSSGVFSKEFDAILSGIGIPDAFSTPSTLHKKVSTVSPKKAGIAFSSEFSFPAGILASD